MNLYEKVRNNLKESSDYWLDKFGQEDLDEYKNNQDEEGIPKNVEPFKVGDLVYLSYIHDTSPYNGVVGKLSWIHKYKYYPFGHKGDSATVVPKYQGKIDYADGDEALISDIYRKGSGVVSPLRKAPKEFKFGDKIPWNYNLKESDIDDWKDPNYKVNTNNLILTNGGYHNNSDIVYGRVELRPRGDMQPGYYDIIYFCETGDLFVFKLGTDVRTLVETLYEVDEDYWLMWHGNRIQASKIYDVINENKINIPKEQRDAIEKAINNAYYNEEPFPLNKVNYD